MRLFSVRCIDHALCVKYCMLSWLGCVFQSALHPAALWHRHVSPAAAPLVGNNSVAAKCHADFCFLLLFFCCVPPRFSSGAFPSDLLLSHLSLCSHGNNISTPYPPHPTHHTLTSPPCIFVVNGIFSPSLLTCMTGWSICENIYEKRCRLRYEKKKSAGDGLTQNKRWRVSFIVYRSSDDCIAWQIAGETEISRFRV